jgi:membrane associated rhomboid family serine protease
MLSDRSYMRDSYGRTTTSTLTWMLCAMSAGFFIQIVFERVFHSAHFENFAGVTGGALISGAFWTLFTHPLLHANVIHWLGNLVTIYFLGKELTPLLGQRRLAWFCVAAASIAAVTWTAVHHGRADKLMGATSVSCALLTLFACLHPNRAVPFLLLFMPVTVKPKYLAWTLGGVTVLGLVLSEIPGDTWNTRIAHSAHLGGMFTAWLYFRFIHLREWQNPDGRTEIELPGWFRKKSTALTVAPTPKYTVNSAPAPAPENLRAEVDRILDKISSQGLGALTTAEKRLLDEARNKIPRR